jgi:hypothetical protein
MHTWARTRDKATRCRKHSYPLRALTTHQPCATPHPDRVGNPREMENQIWHSKYWCIIMNICAQNKLFVHHNNHLCIIKPRYFVDKCSFMATPKLKVISRFHLGYTIFIPPRSQTSSCHPSCPRRTIKYDQILISRFRTCLKIH